jgi:hypothetical protein
MVGTYVVQTYVAAGFRHLGRGGVAFREGAILRSFVYVSGSSNPFEMAFLTGGFATATGAGPYFKAFQTTFYCAFYPFWTVVTSGCYASPLRPGAPLPCLA